MTGADEDGSSGRDRAREGATAALAGGEESGGDRTDEEEGEEGEADFFPPIVRRGRTVPEVTFEPILPNKAVERLDCALAIVISRTIQARRAAGQVERDDGEWRSFFR